MGRRNIDMWPIIANEEVRISGCDASSYVKHHTSMSGIYLKFFVAGKVVLIFTAHGL